MKALVIGSSGQLACALVERAAARGTDLTALGRPQFDITAADHIDDVLDALKPSVVINAAAYTNVDQAQTERSLAHAVNAEGPGLLAAATAARGLPLIHLSTDYVFDGDKDSPYHEDDPISPLGAYGQTKADGETRIAKANPRHVILRTAWVYSPFGKNFVKTMLHLAETRAQLSVVADQKGAPTSATDLAEAVLTIAARLHNDLNAPTGVFHITGAGETTWASFAKAIFTLSDERGGPSAKVEPITTAAFGAPAPRPANSVLNCGKIEKTYGVSLPDWRDSLALCLDRLIAP